MSSYVTVSLIHVVPFCKRKTVMQSYLRQLEQPY